MKVWKYILILSFLLLVGVFYVSSSSSVYNFLTKGYADTLYCQKDDCDMTSKTYYPFWVLTVSGTDTGGNNIGNISYYDDNTYNVTEDAGVDALEIMINFTNVTDFDHIIFREYYEGGAGHEIYFQVWNTISSVWENYGSHITDQSGLTEIELTVSDSVEHLECGLSDKCNVSVRFFHVNSGIPSHKFYIDYVILIDGTTGLTTNEHDSLFGRDEKSNHPWALPTDASRTLTGNLTFSSGNSLYIDADEYFGRYSAAPFLGIKFSLTDSGIIFTDTSGVKSHTFNTNGGIWTDNGKISVADKINMTSDGDLQAGRNIEGGGNLTLVSYDGTTSHHYYNGSGVYIWEVT